jgi:uncharacterized protein YukE
MGDPLSDPRAHDLLAADTGEIGSLASGFRTVAGQAQTAAAALRGAHGDATWTGPAADAFRSQLGKLPGDLDKVQQSYGDVARALGSYETELGPIQSQFRSLSTQLTTARGNLSSAQGSLSTAKTNVTTATSAPKATATTPAVVNAHNALASASGAVNNLQGEVSGLESRGFHLLDEFDTIRGHARSTVSSAAGIAPSQSWLSGALHSIGNFMSGAGHFLGKMVKSVGDAFASLPHDIEQVAEHPTNLHDWSKLGGDLGTVAGAVAVVAAVIVCPLDAVGLEGAAALLGTAGEAAGDVGLASTLVKTDADVSLAATGQGSWDEVISDGVSLGAGAVKVPGLRGAGDDASALEGTEGALEKYTAAREGGATATQAYSALTDSQKSLLRTATHGLSGSHGLNYVQSSVSSALASAKTLERGLDARNEVLHFAFDTGKDAALPKPAEGAGG